MPSESFESTPAEVRRSALLQISLTLGFLVLLFFMLGGSDADHPPIWMAVLLVALIAVGAVLAGRVWLTAAMLDSQGAQSQLVESFLQP